MLACDGACNRDFLVYHMRGYLHYLAVLPSTLQQQHPSSLLSTSLTGQQHIILASRTLYTSMATVWQLQASGDSHMLDLLLQSYTVADLERLLIEDLRANPPHALNGSAILMLLPARHTDARSAHAWQVLDRYWILGHPVNISHLTPKHRLEYCRQHNRILALAARRESEQVSQRTGSIIPQPGTQVAPQAQAPESQS